MIDDILKEKIEEEQKKGLSELQAKWRLVFKDGFGPEILTELFRICGYMEARDYRNPMELGAYNVGVAIAINLGILDPVDRRIDQGIVDALLNIAPKGG